MPLAFVIWTCIDIFTYWSVISTIQVLFFMWGWKNQVGKDIWGVIGVLLYYVLRPAYPKSSGTLYTFLARYCIFVLQWYFCWVWSSTLCPNKKLLPTLFMESFWKAFLIHLAEIAKPRLWCCEQGIGSTFWFGRLVFLRGQRTGHFEARETPFQSRKSRVLLLLPRVACFRFSVLKCIEMRYLNGCYSWRVKWLHHCRPDGIDSSPMKSDWQKTCITWKLYNTMQTVWYTPATRIGTCRQLNLVGKYRVCYISGGAIIFLQQ